MRHSKNYVFTAHTGCASDMLELENIRKAVKIINRELRHFRYGTRGKKSGSGSQSYSQFYVKCQGRGPRTLPSLRDGRGGRGYDQSLPLRHATHMDVYVYEKGDHAPWQKIVQKHQSEQNQFEADAGFAS